MWYQISVSVRFRLAAPREPFQRTFQQRHAAAPLGRCPLGHCMLKCKCNLSIVHMGNNEATFRAYALAKGV